MTLLKSSDSICYKPLGDLDITKLSEQIIWIFILLIQIVALVYVTQKLIRIRKWQLMQSESWNNKLFLINIGCFLLLLVQFSTMVYAEIYSLNLQNESIDDIESFQKVYISLWVFSIVILLSIIGLSSIYWMDVLIHSRYYNYLKYLNHFQKAFIFILYVLGGLSILLLFFDEDITFYVVSILTFAIESIFIVSCFQFWKDIEEIYDLSNKFKRHVKISVFILGAACLLRVIFNICGAAGALNDIHCFDETAKENTHILGSIVSCIVFIFGATLPIVLISSIFSPHRAPKKCKTLISSGVSQN